jgi:hypothetical protein
MPIRKKHFIGPFYFYVWFYMFVIPGTWEMKLIGLWFEAAQTKTNKQIS